MTEAAVGQTYFAAEAAVSHTLLLVQSRNTKIPISSTKVPLADQIKLCLPLLIVPGCRPTSAEWKNS